MMQAAQDGSQGAPPTEPTDRPVREQARPVGEQARPVREQTRPVGAPARPPKWLMPLRNRVVKGERGLLLWRLIIALLGGAVVVLGIVLLPLPGPGWAIIFGGMAIWATEFVWAQRLLAWAKAKLSSYTAWVLRRSMPVRILIAAVAVGLLAGVLYLVWLLLY